MCVCCRRLAKSTLLLIPLFGINYVVFVYLMEPSSTAMKHIKIFFELGLGSFQVTHLTQLVPCWVPSRLALSD